MTKQLVTANTGTVDTDTEKLGKALLEIVIPGVVEAVREEMKKGNGDGDNVASNVRNRLDDAVFDTLPGGDEWADYDLNNPPQTDSELPAD